MTSHGSETIRKYERAAEKRFAEARILRRSARDLAAIYLFGYCIEMWLTSAYFRLRRYSPTTIITGDDRVQAVNRAASYDIRIDKQHDLLGWAMLLVEERKVSPSLVALSPAPAPYPTPFAREIVNQSSKAYSIWRPGLRYSPLDPEGSDIEAVESSAEWFSEHYPAM